jgi:translocation and assembly module TamB
VVNANARWQALDLAALWPQAPQTRLDGEATVTPAGKGWQASVKLSNSLSGPWDQQRLPVNSLHASVEFVAGQWTFKALQASGAGGHIEAQGQLGSITANASAPWQGSATVHGINPAALDSRLATTALDGQLTAQQATAGIAFDARLQTAARNTATAKAKSIGATLAGLRLTTLRAQGLWQAPLLKLETLTLQTDDAQLQGQLTFDTVSQGADARLALTFPGAQAKLEGQIASTRGQGDMSARVTDAALASRWLARLPGAPASLSQSAIQGEAEVTGHWQGGWQKQGQALQIQASLRAPKLDLVGAGQPADQAWRLRELQADLSGTLRALTLTTRGQADKASSHFELQAQARGGRLNDGLWQASVDSAQLTTRSSLRPGSWTLQLSERLALDWKQSGTSQTLEVAAGAARLSGPSPGQATVSWQAARWSQQATGTQWQTQGSLQGVPLAWLDLLGQTQMANLGLRGDLLFGGQWDASGGDTLRLRATLERTSGDLQLLTDNATAGTVLAGVRDARLTLTGDGDRLAASLHWDSERAGQVQASFNTRLQRQSGAWTWPVDAPLTGTLRAQLPPVGAWSVLAPPGWRLRGTLDADATLSGTRGTPQWRGTLRAQDLAVRSAVDGIDFSQGTLSASLNGERLDINEFTLQGAGGASGGRLSVKGSVRWLAPVGPAATTASRLRMELDATAQALRVSARADRRLVVSGKLTARLNEARLVIRGTLKADQALFVLPEDTAPQLGDDVVVRSIGPSPPATDQANATVGLRVTPDVALTLDLGPDFQVRGRGLVTRLAGSLELLSTAERKLVPRLTGTVRTVRGTYKAYGQQLDIEEGELRFAGPFDNPALNILAIRPNLQQRVGVQISGTALSPVVRLYAEPDLPDAEKLAWLVLGRSAARGGAETAVLQQAALALLGGKGKGLSGSLASALGLDELSMRGSADSAGGSTTSGATVTLGKRLSRDFYVAYERSLVGTLGTFSIFYDLSRRFTVRAQAGAQSAVDLIFTIRYD